MVGGASHLAHGKSDTEDLWEGKRLFNRGVLSGLAGLGLAVLLMALAWVPAKEAPRPVPVATTSAAKSEPVKEPEWVELKPVSLDLDHWLPGGEGRRVFAGEELEYQIRWQGVPAGRALLRVKGRHHFPDAEGPEVWHVRLDIRSNRFLTFVYPVKGKTQARIDVKRGFSRHYSKDHTEGSYRAKERLLFDYTLDKLEAAYEYPVWHRLPTDKRPHGKAPWKKIAIPLNGKVLDPLSVVYYLRGLELKPGQSLVLPVITDRRVWNTRIEIQERETLTLPDGLTKVDCLKVCPDCHYNGLFERRGQAVLWLDVKHKVVIRMTVETPLGPCEAWLERHARSPLD